MGGKHSSPGPRTLTTSYDGSAAAKMAMTRMGASVWFWFRRRDPTAPTAHAARRPVWALALVFCARRIAWRAVAVRRQKIRCTCDDVCVVTSEGVCCHFKSISLCAPMALLEHTAASLHRFQEPTTTRAYSIHTLSDSSTVGCACVTCICGCKRPSSRVWEGDARPRHRAPQTPHAGRVEHSALSLYAPTSGIGVSTYAVRGPVR